MQAIESSSDRRYAVTVGTRLRAIRSQQRLSLQDVEARSDEEFKASVLGAYERGERAISVARLQRLARFYGVPVDQLLPGDDGPAFGPRPGDLDLGSPPSEPEEWTRPLRISLGALARVEGERGALLTRFVRLIQMQRGDFNGQVLTVRRDDLLALSCILEVTPEQVLPRLRELGVTFDTL